MTPDSLTPIHVINEGPWPEAIWEGNRRSTILALLRSWQGQAPVAGEFGWCVFYELDRGTLRLLLVIQSGSGYLEAPAA